MARIQKRGPGLFGDAEEKGQGAGRVPAPSATTPPGIAEAPSALTISATDAPCAEGPQATAAPASPAHRTNEAPVTHDREEPVEMIRVTIYATADQIQQLDEDRWRIRRAGRGALERTALVRGILEGYRRAGIDVVAASITNEEDLARLVAGLLAGERA